MTDSEYRAPCFAHSGGLPGFLHTCEGCWKATVLNVKLALSAANTRADDLADWKAGAIAVRDDFKNTLINMGALPEAHRFNGWGAVAEGIKALLTRAARVRELEEQAGANAVGYVALRTAQSAMQGDLARLLRACGRSDAAQPNTPRELMLRCILDVESHAENFWHADDACPTCRSHRDACATLTTELDRYKDVLMPFVIYLQAHRGREPDDETGVASVSPPDGNTVRITFAHLRAVRSALLGEGT